MSTVHEQMAEAVLDDILYDPQAAAVLAETRQDFKSQDFDERYVAWIGQTHRDPAHWPTEQVAAYLTVHAGLGAGTYAKVLIDVGASPGRDADRDGNAAKLHGLHPIFSAALDMHQNGADADGTLWWDTEIKVEKSTGVGYIDHGATRPLVIPHRLAPASVPLEVGYTNPSRTLMHLGQFGGVARWAYGDDQVCLLIDVEKIRFGRQRRRRPGR